MGEARRRQKSGVAPQKCVEAPPPDTVAATALVSYSGETQGRISAALSRFNQERALRGRKPLSRALFLGHILLPQGLQAYEAAVADHDLRQRLVLTPTEAAKLTRPAGR